MKEKLETSCVHGRIFVEADSNGFELEPGVLREALSKGESLAFEYGEEREFDTNQKIEVKLLAIADSEWTDNTSTTFSCNINKTFMKDIRV